MEKFKVEIDTGINLIRMEKAGIQIDGINKEKIKDLTKIKGRFDNEIISDIQKTTASGNNLNKYLDMRITNLGTFGGFSEGQKGLKTGHFNGVDLMSMSISDYKVCLWNILKYALRIQNGKIKEYDLEKIAHYVCLAFNKINRNSNSKMRLIKNSE